MSLTSELTKGFHHIHAFWKSHLHIFMGQLPRATNRRCLPGEGRRWGHVNFVAFPLIFEIVLGTLPLSIEKFLPQEPSGCFDLDQLPLWQTGPAGQT